MPLYRPPEEEVKGLQPHNCIPLGCELVMEQNLSWQAWCSADLCASELRIANYTRVVASVSDALFPVPATLACVQDLSRSTHMNTVLEAYVFYSALFFWLNARGRFFSRTPTSYFDFTEQAPPYIYLFFFHLDMVASHDPRRGADWVERLRESDKELALRLSFADFIRVALVRYAPDHRDINSFISHTLRKNFWMMQHSRGFGRMTVRDLADNFKAAADMVHSPWRITFKTVHFRAGTSVWVRKESAKPEVAVPGFWTHILLHPRLELVPAWVANEPSRAQRLCLVRSCLSYVLPPQEFGTLKQKLIPVLRQFAEDAILLRCKAIAYGDIDTVHAPRMLTAVRMRYCYFVTKKAVTYLVPPLHMLPHWRLSNHDECAIDAEIAKCLFRISEAPTRQLRAFQEPDWPKEARPGSTLLARRFFTLRCAHKMGEDEAWAVVGKPDWKELSDSIEALRSDARATMGAIIPMLPSALAIPVSAAYRNWDRGSELCLPPDIALPDRIRSTLDICMRLHAAHTAVPLPNGAVWHKGLGSDMSERKEPGLGVLDALCVSVTRTINMETRSRTRLTGLESLTPGADVLTAQQIAVLRVLQECSSLPPSLKRKLHALEAHSTERQSSMLTTPRREVFHTLVSALEEMGRIPSELVQTLFVRLSEHMIPRPLHELDRLLTLVLRDFPHLQVSLQADVQKNHQTGSWLLRLPCAARFVVQTRRMQ